jgi:uncharacterized membrane protein YgcG
MVLGGATILGGGFAVSPALANVDDFSFSSMRVTFLLGVDDAGHSTLTTIEKLTAIFPESDQNHGIQRALPLDYAGHGTDLILESVEDSDGVPLEYTAEESEGFLLVTIADPNFIHGAHTYVLTYTQQDVTQTPRDGGGNQEFYRDVNGTGWSQPFDTVVAEIVMPGGLADSLTGQAACYQGPENSTTPCASLERAALGTTADFTATANTLAPGENLTVAIEFAPNTFIERDTAFFSSPGAVPLLMLAVLGVGVLGATLVIRSTRWRDHPGRGIIIAEYGPPEAMTPLVASTLIGQSSKSIAAAILNLAVNGSLRVLDNGDTDSRAPRKRILTRSKLTQDFSLELITPEGVRPEEKELLEALFGSDVIPGAQRGLKAVDAGMNRKLAKLRAHVARSARDSGLRGSIGKGLPAVFIGSSALIALTAIPLAIAISSQEFGGPAPFLLAMLILISALFTLVFSVNIHPLTEQGATVRDHLRGLKEFITLAEADRLRVLQSPTGALRVAVDITDPRLRLKLTEKVLPYAVLFGLEKEWSQELANLYAENDAQPTWYAGGPGFNAALFAASLSTFAGVASTSWAASSSSSGMGGSGGGGFSGGGGGGGGGGGV